MKKQILRRTSYLFLSALISMPVFAHNKVLKCGNYNNNIQIEILSVSGNPSLKVFDLKGDLLIIASDPQGNNNAGKIAHIEGQLVGTSSQSGPLSVSGLINNQDRSDVIINPELITAYLVPNNDGTSKLTIYDEDRIFQHGYGLWLVCI